MSDGLLGDTHFSQTSTLVDPVKPGSSLRTTVLPRVEWIGQQPTVSPTQRNRFEEIGLLGQGGMGEVVLARDHDIDREVALKRLPHFSDLGRVLRFVEEIRAVGQLEHPNIVPVHDVGVDESGRYFFVMKRLQGDTLETIINRLNAGDDSMHARFPMAVRVQIITSMLSALSYAHNQGFLHRDLKPANVMVGPFGEVTLMDWGLARRFRGERKDGLEPVGPSPRDGTALQTQLGVAIGTPLYMSPEQASGVRERLDQRSDLYSLCVVFYELLHLQHYLHDLSEPKQILDAVKTKGPKLHYASPRGPRFQVPAELDWLLHKGLQKDPSLRFQEADELLHEFRQLASGDVRAQCEASTMKRWVALAGKAVDQRPRRVLAGLVSTTIVTAALLSMLVYLAFVK